MRTIRTKVYKFDELTPEAQTKAIIDHIEFIVSQAIDEESYYYQFVEQMERMQTPWFLGQVIYDKAKDVVIEDIKANEYDFFKDGKLYDNR